MSSYPYGRDRYRYIAGQRYQVAAALTLRPQPGETNEIFAERADHIAQESAKLSDVSGVELELEWRRGQIVQALITLEHAPIAAPIASDEGPAGGRISPRGSRGRRAA